MKKLIYLVLAAVLGAALCGCGDTAPVNVQDKVTENLKEITVPEADAPVAESAEDAKAEQNDEAVAPAEPVSGSASFELQMAYATTKVVPNKVQGMYSYSEADAGNVFAVVVADIVYNGSDPVYAEDLYDLTLSVNGTDYTVSGTRYLKDDGATLASGYMEMPAGEVFRMYYMFAIPEGEADAPMHLNVQRGEDVMTSDFELKTVAAQAPHLKVGDSVLSTEGYNATIKDLFLTTDLMPSAPTGMYTHYIPETDGNKLLVMQVEVSELAAEASKLSLVMGATLIDAQRCSAPGQIIVERFDSGNLLNFSDLYEVSCNGTMYYMFQASDAQLGDGAYLQLYANGTYYVMELDGVGER